MKRILMIFSVLLLFTGCVKEKIYYPRYDLVFESHDGVLLSKRAVRNDREKEVFGEKNGYLVFVSAPIITYQFWFEVYRKNAGDTVFISVPFEIYERYKPGDKLGS